MKKYIAILFILLAFKANAQIFSTNSIYQFNKGCQLKEMAAPSTPASGFGHVYMKSDGHLYLLNDSGTEIDLSATGAGTGTVTSVGLTVPSLMTVSNTPVTTSGTIGISWNGTSRRIPFFGESDLETNENFQYYWDDDLRIEAKNGATFKTLGSDTYTELGELAVVAGFNSGGGYTAMSSDAILFVNTIADGGGSLGIQKTAGASDYTIHLPASQGAANTTLSNNGSGVLTWQSFLTSEVDGSLTNEVQNLSYDAANHEIDISLSGTSSVIPLALGDGATEGLASFSDKFTLTSGNVDLLWYNSLSVSTESISLGLSAMNNASNVRNVMVGFEGGNGITSGQHNVGVGHQVLKACSTCRQNTAVGSGALEGATTTSGSDGNAAFGMNSLNIADGASENVAFGKNTGLALQTGDQNIFIGFGAGLTQTTGSNNIMIGVNAIASGITASNEINIGGKIFNNSTGTSIGDQSPDAFFTIGATSQLRFNSTGKLTRYNDAAPVDGQVFIGNTGTGTFDAATITAGSGITVTNGSGTITIDATGGGITFQQILAIQIIDL